MRTVEGFKTTIIGIIIVELKNVINSDDHEKIETTAERILELFGEELTRTAWKNIRDKYKTK